ncbi:MAG: proton-dependent oligopeptide transporter, family [Acidobacteriota bacterium]|jgi:POT family proton-dependent oligopeptide transporter|nr:proton-dependent oligopeptide transporter, family [Acidobacteriota bacterium]
MSLAVDSTGVSPDSPRDTSGIGGHPRGLSTLFFTEMWERFSYYGMRAILMLYMTKAVTEGGLAFETKYAGLIFGTYASSVYWTPLIGGWLADKVFGTRRAVLIGGIIIACGHFSMVFHTMANFYGGLALIAVGTGLLKPNVSAMVGQMYAEGDERRDAGFSIFYMGINLGALIAPIICGWLGQKVDWHYGFAAAGFGMVLGLVQYVLSADRLRGIGDKPVRNREPDIDQLKAHDASREFDVVTAALAVVGGAVGAYFSYDPAVGAVSALFFTVVGIAFGYIAGMCRHLGRAEMGRVGVIFILFVFSVIFWMSFEQAATSLTLFADQLTRTNVLGYEFPSSWFQTVQPTFVILLAPVFAGIWLSMRRRNPSSPVKFAVGLIFAGLAFALVAFASTLTGGGKVSPWWLVAVYLLQTLGELCLSPVGLSTVTKLSPARMVGLMMGVWFLSISFGNFIAGKLGGEFTPDPSALARLFGGVAVITGVAALILFALTPLIKKMTPRES